MQLFFCYDKMEVLKLKATVSALQHPFANLFTGDAPLSLVSRMQYSTFSYFMQQIPNLTTPISNKNM
jgi:hypothetical protein